MERKKPRELPCTKSVMFDDRPCLGCARIGIERVFSSSVRRQYENTREKERHAERLSTEEQLICQCREEDSFSFSFRETPLGQ